MPYSERVPASSAFSLYLESTGLAMHTGAVAIYDAGPLTAPDGTLEIDRIEAALASALEPLERFRQRLRSVPVEEQPVWIDDDRFKLHFHLRHTRLPRPGTERQLKRLAGRLMSERLDRRKPLWEAWVIEGLERERVALMLKLHPALLEETQPAEVFARLSREPGAAERRWRARKAPGPAQLIADSVNHWSAGTREALERVRAIAGAPLEGARAALRRTRAAGEAVSDALSVARHPQLNPRQIGGHRRVDWLQLPRERVESIARALDVTVSDVALALLAGALHRFLQRRGDGREPETLCCALAPAPESGAVAGEAGDAALGAALRMALPYGEADPIGRVTAVARAREAAQGSLQPEAAELLGQLESWAPARVQKLMAQLAGRRALANLEVHFARGLLQPASLLGAPLESWVVLAPLLADQALGFAITEVGGALSVGINSDWDLLPDLHSLATGIEKALAELAAATAARTPASAHMGRSA